MSSPPIPSLVRRWHRLLERYTPDGTLGRVLLGASALGIAPVLLFGGFAIFSGAPTILLFFIGLLGMLASVPAVVLGIVCLWPVYLSLIGNVESPAAYPGATRRVRTALRDEETDAEATLKRRYAEGEISREEFEARLDALLEADEYGRGRDAPADERHLETESAR